MNHPKGAQQLQLNAAPRTANFIARFFYLLLCLEAVLSIPYLDIHSTTHSISKALAASVLLGLFALLLYWRRNSVLNWISIHLGEAPQKATTWLLSWLAAGTTLRVLWVCICPHILYADGFMYDHRAYLLATRHVYQGAFWPPGFSFFLTPFFAVFGYHYWVTVLASILLFIGTYWFTYLLARDLAAGWPALLAPALLAIWPAFVTIVSTNAKESLLAFLTVVGLYNYFRSTRSLGRHEWLHLVFAGLLFGAATLTQPAFLLFPGVLFLADCLQRISAPRTILRCIVFTCALVLVLSPWVYRNYNAFHRFPVLTTGGGITFYVANNPYANGSANPPVLPTLPADPFIANKEGYRLGEQWIRSNPWAFLKLSFRKQTYNYLADADVVGIHNAWKVNRPHALRIYAPAKLFCVAFWLGCWVLLLLGFPKLFQQRRWPVWYAICFLPMVYQWAIESIFVSGSRHHTPYLPLLCILMALILAPQNNPAVKPEAEIA